MQSERRYFRYFRKNSVRCFGQCLHLYAAPKSQSHASDGEMMTTRHARLSRKKPGNVGCRHCPEICTMYASGLVSLCCVLFNDLILNVTRCLLIAYEAVLIIAGTAGHGTKVGAVAVQI